MPMMPPAIMLASLEALIASYDAMITSGEKAHEVQQEFLAAQRAARAAMWVLRAELLAQLPPRES